MSEPLESSADEVPFSLLPYGAANFRLLRYLPSCLPVWEAPPYNANSSSSAAPPEDLHQFSEAFCLAVDTLERMRPLMHDSHATRLDPSLLHPDMWLPAITYRDNASRWLASLLALADLMLGTLSQPKNQPFMTATEARHDEANKVIHRTDATIDALHQKGSEIASKNKCLRIAMASRYICFEKLEARCVETVEQIQMALKMQKEFLSILRQLRINWKLLRRKYTSVDFTQTCGNYPYLAEIVVEYFGLPAKGWDLGDNPVFLTWPPYPNTPPFRTQFAHIQVKVVPASTQIHHQGEEETVDTKKEESNPFSVRHASICFEGSAAHFIENRFKLNFSIHFFETSLSGIETPTNLREIEIPYTDLTDSMTADIPHPLAEHLHTQLKNAQWILLDRALFSVIACHASRLQSTSHATERGKAKQYETFLKHLNRVGELDHEHAEERMVESVDCIHYDSSEISLYLKGIKTRKTTRESCEEGISTGSLEERKDAILYFSFLPSTTEQRFKRDNDGGYTSDSYTTDGNIVKALEQYGVAKLRSIFIDTWKFKSVEMPQICLDIHPTLASSTLFRERSNRNVLSSFLSWVIPHLVDIKLSRIGE